MMVMSLKMMMIMRGIVMWKRRFWNGVDDNYGDVDVAVDVDDADDVDDDNEDDDDEPERTGGPSPVTGKESGLCGGMKNLWPCNNQ